MVSQGESPTQPMAMKQTDGFGGLYDLLTPTPQDLHYWRNEQDSNGMAVSRVNSNCSLYPNGQSMAPEW